MIVHGMLKSTRGRSLSALSAALLFLVAGQAAFSAVGHAAGRTHIAFRSHPPIHVPSRLPSGGHANAPANQGLQSTNWSGYALTGSSGAYSAATGCWTVPTVTATPGTDTYSSSWVGIDGATNSDLIQTGTLQAVIQGSATYEAWWEILPAQATPITTVAISPGDDVCASVARGSGGNWTISLTDETTTSAFSTAQPYAGPAASAEWILEEPYVCSGGSCGASTLANYGQETFDPVSVNGQNPALTLSDSISMVDGSGTTISQPSSPDSDTDGFAVAYGSATPAPPSSQSTPSATSASPTSGATLGGAAVTISGSGFEPGATVDFGSNQAPGVYFDSPYEVVATSPPGSVGTVNITLTDPGGAASTLASAFTYTLPSGGGYTLDGFGGLHPIGDSPPVTVTGYWPGWNIARVVVMNPCDTGNQISGWVMDGFGGLHPFYAYGTPQPPVPDFTGYWPGWSIANDVVAWCDQTSHTPEGCTLDGFGGLHPWADTATDLKNNNVSCKGSGYWPGWDVATRISLIPGTTTGYVMDGFGGLHPFAAQGAPMPTSPTDEAYWPNWPIARDVVATGNGTGYTLDGFGGVHPFGGIPTPSGYAYWPGWDIARAIDLQYGGSGAYSLDGFGGVHPMGGAPSLTISGYWPGWNIAVDLATGP